MSDSFFRRFLDNFGTIPPERPPLIPERYRMPFFLGLSVLALVTLVLVVWLVVIPGIAAEQATTRVPPAAVSAPKK